MKCKGEVSDSDSGFSSQHRKRATHEHHLTVVVFVRGHSQVGEKVVGKSDRLKGRRGAGQRKSISFNVSRSSNTTLCKTNQK